MNLTKKQLDEIKQRYRLSPRETEIVNLLFTGVESNAELAEKINVTVPTIKTYLHVLYAKVGKSTKLGLVLKLSE
jgi:ATP/maltotriose-dependent transcriptional regulator MalT